MKSFRHHQLLLSLVLASLAANGWLRAAEQPSSPPPAEAPPAEAPPAVTPEERAEAAQRQAEQRVEEVKRQAEQAVAEAEAAAAQARAEAVKAREEVRSAVKEAVGQAVEQAQEQISESENDQKSRRSGRRDSVAVGDDNHIPAGVTVPHNAVAVMGDLRVDGEVMHDAVAVMGDNTINGHVHHSAIAIMGDIKLGPKAVVDGDLVCVGGDIHREPGAVVHGRVQMRAMGPGLNPDAITNWWDHALKIGRPLAFGAGLGWLWFITGFSVAFYALLGLVFPRRITACGDKLVQEPGLVILSAMLSVLALPVLFVLLCITIIGIPVALLVLPVGCMFVAMFGKAAIYGLIGRKLTGDRFHPAISVLLGALLAVLLYLLPVVGLLLSLLVWFLGFGCAVLVMFGRPKPVAPAPSAPPPLPVPPMPAAASSSFAAETQPAAFAAEPPPVPPAAGTAARTVAAMVVTADTTPRAGFWIRVGAAMLDFLMFVFPLAILGGLNDGPGLLFVGLAAYHATMWKLKGTTIGGIICGLKVVRLDDRPLDWGVTVARALSAFLSLFLIGLGFIWVVFDDEKQSWHDKVAGTTIVKVPKGMALL